MAIIATAHAVSQCGCGPSPGLDAAHLAQIDALLAKRTTSSIDTVHLLRTDPRAAVPAPVGTLLPGEAIDRTLAHNLSLVASAENLRIAQARLAQAGLLQNPTIGGTGPVSFPITAGGGAAAFDVAVSQVINTFFTRPYRVAAAEAARFQSGIDLASQAYDLAQQAQSKYDEMAHLLRNIKLAERIAASYKRAWDAAEARIKVGVIPRPDVNRARLQYADQLRQIRHLETQYRRAAREMNWLMGVSGPPQWTLPAEVADTPARSLPLPDGVALESLARQYRLDLLRADFDRRIAEANVHLARLGMIPQTTIGPDAARDSAKQWSIGFTWNVELPIFDTGKVGVALAEAQRLLADKTYVALEGQVAQDVRSAYDDLRMSDEDVRFYRDQLIPQAEENVQLAQQSFRLGNSDLDELLNTLREYVATLQAYEDAIDSYHDHRIALQKAAGLAWERMVAAAPPAATQPSTLPAAAAPAATTNESTAVPASMPANQRVRP